MSHNCEITDYRLKPIIINDNSNDDDNEGDENSSYKNNGTAIKTKIYKINKQLYKIYNKK